MKKKLFKMKADKYTLLKRKFIVLLVIFILFILGVAFYIYLNFDYLVFKHLISQNYIYTDTMSEIFKEELNIDTDSFYSGFDDVVISIVSKHIRAKNGDRYTYLYLPDDYKQYTATDKADALKTEVKKLSDNAAYIRITNFSKITKNILNSNKEELANYPNLIIDLRDNYGGMINDLNDMASLFLERGTIISKDETRSPLFSKTTRSNVNKYFDFEKIIILQNKNTASSAEGFIAALKDNLDNVTLIGDTTFGKGIGQITLPLKNGYAMKATVLKWYTPGGVNIQGIGIAPEVRYTNNDIIDYALKYVQ